MPQNETKYLTAFHPPLPRDCRLEMQQASAKLHCFAPLGKPGLSSASFATSVLLTKVPEPKDSWKEKEDTRVQASRPALLAALE